jgi:DNA-binding transcriptional regulator YhcF (GntR family)
VRFWITKNGTLPVREQLVCQVLLGIMSEELPPGHKLPSVRALARQYHIHSNTVSSAYHELLQRGWLELRKGSGVYVRPLVPAGGSGGLEELLVSLLRTTQSLGYTAEEVLGRMERLVRPRTYARVLIAEPEEAMSEILRSEIADCVRVPVEPFSQPCTARDAIVATLITRIPLFRGTLPVTLPCVALRLRSVRGSIEGRERPAANALVSIVSKSAEIRMWARAMLLAVGIEPDCLAEVDAGVDGWRERLALSSLVVTDVVTAKELPPHCPAQVFRVISDASIEELRESCGA